VQLADAINARYSPNPPVTTDRVLSISCGDLEAQDHILRYQLPVVVERHHIGLVVIDSIAANFRAEFDRSPSTGDHHPTPKRLKTLGESGRPAQMARRGGELVDVAHGLRELARKHNLAVVVANQVSDRFSPLMGDDDEQDDLALDYQSRWFTGWGGESGGVGGGKAKVPALGLVWANLLAGRVVVRKADEAIAAKRKIGVVFANWAPPRVGENEIEFEIWEGGIRAISPGAVTADVQEEGTGQQGLSIYG
jgi:DNA repair protein RAD57